MSLRGGVRPGAGRKPKAEKFKLPIARAEKRIADELPALIANLVQLANGVTIEETGKDGGKLVYRRPPDFKANEYLINRLMGRPTERIEAEVTVEDVSAHDSLQRKLAQLAARTLPSGVPTEPDGDGSGGPKLLVAVLGAA